MFLVMTQLKKRGLILEIQSDGKNISYQRKRTYFTNYL